MIIFVSGGKNKVPVSSWCSSPVLLLLVKVCRTCGTTVAFGGKGVGAGLLFKLLLVPVTATLVELDCIIDVDVMPLRDIKAP